jgi:hypothetical protein
MLDARSHLAPMHKIVKCTLGREAIGPFELGLHA